MDKPSLYHMMTRTDPIALDIFDFEGYVIQSEKGARRQRDAVFCFLFNIKKIKGICSSTGGFKFGHSITIKSGAKSQKCSHSG